MANQYCSIDAGRLSENWAQPWPRLGEAMAAGRREWKGMDFGRIHGPPFWPGRGAPSLWEEAPAEGLSSAGLSQRRVQKGGHGRTDIYSSGFSPDWPAAAAFAMYSASSRMALVSIPATVVS